MTIPEVEVPLNVAEAVQLALFYRELLDLIGSVEGHLVTYMNQTGRKELVAGDVAITLKEPGKTYDHETAARAVLDTMDPDQAEDILAKCTPDPKVSWSKVTAELDIPRKDIPSHVSGSPAYVFAVGGEKTQTIQVPIETKVFVFSEDQEEIPF